MTSVVVIGAGGHAKVIIDMLLDNGLTVVACVSHADAPRYRDIQVLVGDESLVALRAEGVDAAVVAVGANALRQRLAADAVALGFSLPPVVSRSAQISPTARIGEGAVIMPNAVVNADAAIGRLAIVNTGATVDHDCVVGEAAHVAPGVHFSGGVRLGTRSIVGVGSSARPLVVIGDDVVIGAGSVLVSDIADGVTAYGVPARSNHHPGSTLD
jgi:UDP-perosamine 4-acetyltransferase